MALLEVIIGSVLVALAAVGVALMFSSGQASIHADADNRIALFLANQRIEAIRAQGYTGTLAALGTVVETRDTAGSTLQDNRGYRRTTVITDQCPANYVILRSSGACPSPPATDQAKLVTVTVEPMEGDSTAATDRMASPVTIQAVLVRTF
jgi:type II secretory pathway pseudopilin PulG